MIFVQDEAEDELNQQQVSLMDIICFLGVGVPTSGKSTEYHK